jgi:pimeloyl-ACP methyl ester carboxylesterase
VRDPKGRTPTVASPTRAIQARAGRAAPERAAHDLPGCGHRFLFQHRSLFAADVDAFLEKLD